MAAGETKNRGASQNAEAVFAEFLRQRKAGGDPDFERLCSERPEITDALRLLYSMHAGKPQSPSRPSDPN